MANIQEINESAEEPTPEEPPHTHVYEQIGEEHTGCLEDGTVVELDQLGQPVGDAPTHYLVRSVMRCTGCGWTELKDEE